MTFGNGITDSVIEIPPDAVTDIGPGDDWPGDSGPFDDFTPPPSSSSGEIPKEDKAKAGPPRLDEWQNFFARVLIKGLTERYIAWAFRGIDEDLLSDREVSRLSMTDTERNKIAKPFAELANKSKFTRKHGRSIIALSDSIDSVVALGMWFSRVNRIAGKYAKTRPVKVTTIKDADVSSGPAEETRVSANGHSNGGYVYGVWPESPGTG